MSKIEGVPDDVALAWDEEISARDRVWRIERHCHIKDTGGQIRPIGRLKRGQEKLLALIGWLREREQPVRVVVLKARKVGSSTAVEADLLCEVMDRQIDAMVIAHEVPTSRLIRGMARLMHERYELAKPTLAKDNIREITFENHHGKIVIDTANNKFAGTGATPQYLHASELSKWETGAETAIALLQSVADRDGTTVVMESTANGYDSLFYPTWKAAWENCEVEFEEYLDEDREKRWRVKDCRIKNRLEWNYYYPLFISVFDDPECERHFQDDRDRAEFEASLTSDEREIMERYRCSLEYLNYRRFTLKNKCQNDIEIYFQEHCETDSHAFLASGRPRFNRELLAKMPVERGSVGWLESKQVAWRPQVVFLEDDGEFLTVFRRPVTGHKYAIGVDVAEGKIPEGSREADRSVAVVLDLEDGCRQVATLTHETLGPEGMGQRLKVLGRWYNEAFVVCEKNAQGVATLLELRGGQDAYPPAKVYRMGQESGRSQTDTGWITNVNSRPRMLTKLAHAFVDGSVTLHDRRTVEECQNFVYTASGRAEAQRGFHDDHVFALAMAVMGAEWYPHHADAARNGEWNMRRERQMHYAAANSVTGY